MNKAAETNTGLVFRSNVSPTRKPNRDRNRKWINPPIRSVSRNTPRLGRRGDLDERRDEPADAVQPGAEGVACAAVGRGERFGGVGVENAVHLCRWGGQRSLSGVVVPCRL